jgi:hypothetical protein
LYWSCDALADAEALALAEALTLAEALLLADALLVEGDRVVVPWALAGVLGSVSDSQFRRNVKPATSTNAITATLNVVLTMISSLAESPCWCTVGLNSVVLR